VIHLPSLRHSETRYDFTALFDPEQAAVVTCLIRFALSMPRLAHRVLLVTLEVGDPMDGPNLQIRLVRIIVYVVHYPVIIVRTIALVSRSPLPWPSTDLLDLDERDPACLGVRDSGTGEVKGEGRGLFREGACDTLRGFYELRLLT